MEQLTESRITKLDGVENERLGTRQQAAAGGESTGAPTITDWLLFGQSEHDIHTRSESKLLQDVLEKQSTKGG